MQKKTNDMINTEMMRMRCYCSCAGCIPLSLRCTGTI